MTTTRRTVLLAITAALFVFGSVTMAAAPRPALDKMMGMAKSTITNVTVAQADQMGKMFPNMVWVDVRTGSEWSAGHIPGAVHIDRGLLEFRAETVLPDKSAKILIYCKSGGRGTLATKTLMDMGYTDVRNMAGGYTEWAKAGKPTQM